jgi:rSAM/selenodomain-associated transferase 2
MNISIIIPALNEEENIGKLVSYLKENAGREVIEVITVDGGSTDATVIRAKEAGAEVVVSAHKGRAIQMNTGASLATGDILYFIHADTSPPPGFTADILEAVNQGYKLGRYKTKFISGKWLLRLNEWFTSFDLFVCMGGDQTLFVARKLFTELHGFNQDMHLMEEYEFCKRAREKAKYKIMDGHALVSSRKYKKNSWLTVQLANCKIISMYKNGVSQQSMVKEYKRRLKW